MKWFGKKSQQPILAQHPLELTPLAADEIKFAFRRLKFKKASSLIFAAFDQDGHFFYELYDDPAILDQVNPPLLFAHSHGVLVAVLENHAHLLKGYFLTVSDNKIILIGEFKGHDNSASNPGRLRASEDKFSEMLELSGREFNQFDFLKLSLHLIQGDSQAAIVMSVDPLVVAALSDEMDAVVLVQYPSAYVQRYRLKPGMKMLTVNMYPYESDPPADLVRGPEYLGRYNNFWPVIAAFLTDDLKRVKQLTAGIPDKQWHHCLALAKDAMRRAKGRYRNCYSIDLQQSAY